MPGERHAGRTARLDCADGRPDPLDCLAITAFGQTRGLIDRQLFAEMPAG
jgi:hypothetical protein